MLSAGSAKRNILYLQKQEYRFLHPQKRIQDDREITDLFLCLLLRTIAGGLYPISWYLLQHNQCAILTLHSLLILKNNLVLSSLQTDKCGCAQASLFTTHCFSYFYTHFLETFKTLYQRVLAFTCVKYLSSKSNLLTP